MRLAIFGDLHANPDRALKFIDRMEPDSCLQVGDYKCYGVLWPVPFYWIAGNHEERKTIVDIIDGKLTLPRNNTLLRAGIVHNICGLKVVGLPGLNRINPAPGQASFPRAAMERCLEIDESLKIDIFLSHGCGFPFWIDVYGHRINAEETAITNLIRRLKPKIAISGHNHFFADEIYDKIRCIRLGKCNDNGFGEYILTDENFV